jgi:hypothetical protein
MRNRARGPDCVPDVDTGMGNEHRLAAAGRHLVSLRLELRE